MAVSKFRYQSDIPAEILPAVRRVLEPLACLIPGWCHHVNVHYASNDPADPDADARCFVHYEYRWATIRILGAWVESDPRMRREALIHELCHLSIGPLSEWGRDTLKRLVPASDAEKFNGQLCDEHRQRVESAVQDMAHVIGGVLKG